MITGIHSIVFATDADKTRAFIRDVLGWSSVDAGGGWSIFATPPTELAVHPVDEGEHHELYLMCDDIEKTIDELKNKGVEFTSEVADKGWGLLTSIKVPGGGEMGLYEPRHPTAI